MVFLHNKVPSRKRPSSSSSTVPPFPPPKIPKATMPTPTFDKMVSILAEAGCTLLNPAGPPCLPSQPHKFRSHLHRLFSSPDVRSDFLSAFSSYIHSPHHLRRVLTPTNNYDGFGSTRSKSLVQHLLLVPSIQLDLQSMLLEKLPEYFDLNAEHSGTLVDDIARLIVNQFRWLDFIVDSNAFANNLMQVLSICPPNLKKEIIGSLPEIIGDQNNKTVVDCLEQMLQEDSDIIVPVLDSLSNLNLDEQLQEQVIRIALSCVRVIDAEHMPYLLRFLLLSATPANVWRIISQIREQLKFVGVSNYHASQHSKIKGKSLVNNTEASILDALRSSLRFKSLLCQEILKQLNCLEKPQDHKVIDIWLLMLIYSNGESLQKSIVKMFKKKIIEDCIRTVMLDQCICGNKELVKVLGALVTHVGSGVTSEVQSALETMTLLASKFAQDLIPLSSHITGILDYLDGFSVENLHKVYEAFSHLALSARSSADSYGSSIANKLLMIIRKQVSNPDLKYKKMGLIGTLQIVSCFGDANSVCCASASQKSNCEEALELLNTSLDSCKQSPLPLILFYDELNVMLANRTLHPSIMEWVGKQVGEFESVFLSDLESGKLPFKEPYFGLEGELWMNLDGDISPVCLNILPLASSSMQSSSLQILPANFLILSTIERLTNQGSLGGIDALLGCPLHLPSSKYFSGAGWKSLAEKQKQIVCLSLYYAANWIRELLNAFCTQVEGRIACTSQATKEDTVFKLLKRLRNLVFLEILLNNSIEGCSISLPELHFYVDHFGSPLPNQHMGHIEKSKHQKTQDSNMQKNRRHKKISKASGSDADGKLRQPTILDAFKKVGVVTSQEVPNKESLASNSQGRASNSANQNLCDSSEPDIIEVAAVAKALEVQRFKFRPLLVQCFSILAFSENQGSCCSDPAAEFPLYLYLLRDLHYKLNCFTPGKQFLARSLSPSAGFTRMTVDVFMSKIRPLFPSIQKHFKRVVCSLKESDETCQEHWKVQSASAKNPDVSNLVLSRSAVSTLVFKETLCCFSKMLNLPAIQREKPVLSDLLEAFQPNKIPDSVLSDIQPNILPGTVEYLYLGAYSYIESVLNTVCSFSFTLASESLLTLESIVNSFQNILAKLEENGKITHSECIQGVLPALRSRLGASAQKLLRHNWDNSQLESGWKSRGEIIQKMLHIYLENSESTSDLLDELACYILPQVSQTKEGADHHGFPTLCSATFVLWYRVLHEVNLTILNKLVKEVILLEKPRAGVQVQTVEKLLIKLRQSVNVVVSLVNMCRTHHKVTVHAMAVKYGGKFVDSFLKVFDFLQAHFNMFNELIIQLVRDLQKATRTIQALCSEAKGLKQTVITSKIPATKRSMERFLFCVKALLHTTSSGCSFWMGNLKHKDLMGQVVSSQAYADDQDNNEENSTGAADDDLPATIASEEEREAERT
nr:Fanconi anemia group D2 protein homolog isoform X3 [Quercus suber]